MKSSIRLLFVIALSLLSLSCGQSEWRPMEVSEGGFRVLMRGQPNVTRQQFDTPAGKMTAFLYSSDRPLSYYAVGYTDYPLALVVGKDPYEVFEGVRNTWVRRIGGRRVGSDGKLTLSGKYQGLEFTAEGDSKGTEAVMQARLFLVDQRLYQVIAMGRKNAVPQGEINRFLNSFALVPTSEVGTLQITPPAK
ncbi:MAG TPA: hypothetical protein VHP37_20990 [Burkholderiales bacterium]|nr:hypothetical protein [Burkholderiales bacterium]